MKPLQSTPCFPAFTPPPSKLVFYSDSRRSDGEQAYQRLMKSHAYVHALQLFVPFTRGTDPGVFAETLLAENLKFHFVHIQLKKLIDLDFLNAFVRNPKRRVYMLSCCLSGEMDDMVALLPEGILTLNVTKDTYETLGLVGRPSKFGDERQRWIVDIDLRGLAYNAEDDGNDEKKEKQDRLQRVRWCFDNTCTREFKFYFACFDTESSQFVCPPDAFKPRQHEITKTHKHFDSIAIPSFTTFLSSISETMPTRKPTAKDTEIIHDLFEWVGLVSIHANERLNPDTNGDTDPFICTYSEPSVDYEDGYEQGIWIEFRGFLVPELVDSIYKTVRSLTTSDEPFSSPFVLVSMHSFLDTPLNFTKSHNLPMTQPRKPNSTAISASEAIYYEHQVGPNVYHGSTTVCVTSDGRVGIWRACAEHDAAE